MSDGALRRIYRLEVPGDPKSLALVRKVINHLALTVGFEDVDASKIEIAVDEACANIIEHAYSELPHKPPVTIRVELTPSEFVVDITDQGKSFDTSSYTEPTFPDHWDQGHTRGVGVYLMNQCMDHISFSQTPESHNHLRMVKKLNPQPAGSEW